MILRVSAQPSLLFSLGVAEPVHVRMFLSFKENSARDLAYNVNVTFVLRGRRYLIVRDARLASRISVIGSTKRPLCRAIRSP